MKDHILNLGELNRTTLARQNLLKREEMTVTDCLHSLVGLQAQVALPPYVGLWTRLIDFKRADLADLIENHGVVKATMMRATLHLLTSDDYVKFRTTLQPALTGASESIVIRRGEDFDMDQVLNSAQVFIAEKPRTFAEISEMLSTLIPDHDVGSMRYSVRTHLPMVQVPISTGWSFPGKPSFTLAESWIGKPVDQEDHIHDLVLRYLSSFGPASVADMQTWSGLTGLKTVFEKYKSDLITYRDESNRELFDLPDQEILNGDIPAPVRFLPEFDNLLLSHKIRTRILADEFRSKVFLKALRVAATILVDGFVHGSWKVEKTRAGVTLVIEPFTPFTQAEKTETMIEAERLVRFIEPEANTYVVKTLSI